MLGLLPLAALLAIFLCLSPGSKAGATPVDLTVMTQNLYVGADADCRLSNPTLTKTWERGPASIVEARCASPVPPRERPTPLRGTEGETSGKVVDAKFQRSDPGPESSTNWSRGVQLAATTPLNRRSAADVLHGALEGGGFEPSVPRMRPSPPWPFNLLQP
jgi:hypothetical protein